MKDNIVAAIMVSLQMCMLQSCNDTKSNISKMYDQHVHWDVSEMEQYIHQYFKDNKDLSLSRDYHLIVYSDSMECMSCMTNKLHSWDKLINYVDSTSKNVDFIFVFSPMKSELNNLKVALEMQRFRYPVYIDINHVFSMNNSFIPDESLYHTFLVDKHFQIRIVGDPRRNPKLMDMFYLEIEK